MFGDETGGIQTECELRGSSNADFEEAVSSLRRKQRRKRIEEVEATRFSNKEILALWGAVLLLLVAVALAVVLISHKKVLLEALVQGFGAGLSAILSGPHPLILKMALVLIVPVVALVMILGLCKIVLSTRRAKAIATCLANLTELNAIVERKLASHTEAIEAVEVSGKHVLSSLRLYEEKTGKVMEDIYASMRKLREGVAKSQGECAKKLEECTKQQKGTEDTLRDLSSKAKVHDNAIAKNASDIQRSAGELARVLAQIEQNTEDLNSAYHNAAQVLQESVRFFVCDIKESLQSVQAQLKSLGESLQGAINCKFSAVESNVMETVRREAGVLKTLSGALSGQSVLYIKCWGLLEELYQPLGEICGDKLEKGKLQVLSKQLEYKPKLWDKGDFSKDISLIYNHIEREIKQRVSSGIITNATPDSPEYGQYVSWCKHQLKVLDQLMFSTPNAGPAAMFRDEGTWQKAMEKFEVFIAASSYSGTEDGDLGRKCRDCVPFLKLVPAILKFVTGCQMMYDGVQNIVLICGEERISSSVEPIFTQRSLSGYTGLPERRLTDVAAGNGGSSSPQLG